MQPTPVMPAAGLPALMAAPDGPRQTEHVGARRQWQRNLQEPPRLRHGYVRELGGWIPPLTSSVLRMAASQACASIDKVIWRCQLGQERTS